MRVALLAPHFDSTYGWARYGWDLARALGKHGVEVVALTQSAAPPADFPGLVDTRPVLPWLMPPRRWFIPRLLASVNRVRRAVADCNLLHVVAEPYAPLAAWAAGRRPLVVTAHGTYVPLTSQRRLVGKLYRQAYRRAHLIAVSRYTAGQVQAVLPQVRLTMIHNGVHAARFQAPQPAPAKLGPTVLASGGVKPRKGTHILIAAMAQVQEQIPDVQLVVTGGQRDSGYLAQVQQQTAQFGLNHCVHLVGQIPESELLSWYQHADVFALPSLNVRGRFEGFGLVFLEASAAGLPVVGTTGSGVEEAVIDGQTGLLVPQNDADALAGAIIRLLMDKALRQQMGRAGQRYAQSQDWSEVAGHVIQLYEQLLAK